MSAHDVEVFMLKSEIYRLEGKSNKIAQEVIDLLGAALVRLHDKRPEVAAERIETIIELLLQLIG